MSGFDWGGLGVGAAAGLVAGVLFLGGLAIGMRLALRSSRPMPVLVLSSALRIAALLGAVWLIAQSGLAMLVGFALAFVALRIAAVSLVRPAAGPEPRGWN
ncbi:MAG: ATP synthase subunit I [Silicimonas sp.]